MGCGVDLSRLRVTVSKQYLGNLQSKLAPEVRPCRVPELVRVPAMCVLMRQQFFPPILTKPASPFLDRLQPVFLREFRGGLWW